MSNEEAPKAVEIDYTPYLRSKEVPLFVKEDLLKCNSLWVSVPKLPEDAVEFHLIWKNEWIPWEYEEGNPNISNKAIVVKKFEAFGDQIQQLCYQQEREWMKEVHGDNEFTLFLCVGQEFRQGVVAETGSLYGYLQKSFCVLGRRKKCRKSKEKSVRSTISMRSLAGQSST